MDRFKQKHKKDKSFQNDTREKCVADVKCIRENIKIREILRNVKMNNSMRLKAPPGSKVMSSKDFSDCEDYFDEIHNDESNDEQEPPHAMNHDVIISHPDILDVASDSIDSSATSDKHVNLALEKCRSISETNLACTVKNTAVKFEPIKRSESMVPDVRSVKEILNNLPTAVRNRKLSLDQSALNRCFSQSELDLHTLGKSPLERKSSFFRKKMDSFLKNTTHLFKKQSSAGQYQKIGKGSKSLQSLDENSLANANDGDYLQNTPQQEMLSVSRSTTSLLSESTVASSSSSQPLNLSLAESLTTLSIQNLDDLSSNSIDRLNETYIQEAMLTSRAISMSSGLDNTSSHQRRKSRANRVTWLASEGLTNYFRRVIQDEKSKEKMKSYHSYQDFSSIPENESYGSGTDSKGRRLSYQRAVSGEDPVLPLRHQDSTLRRRNLIPEKSEGNYELQNHLAEFSKNGVPALQGFLIATIPENSFSYLMWSEQAGNLEQAYDWKTLDENEQKKQAVIRELVETEANYIQHLMVIVEVFIAAAHSLQDSGKMLEIDTARLFSNIPDLLNANLIFWNLTFYPMVKDAVENKTPYKVELMTDGFSRFQEIFQPYEKYMYDQSKMMIYLRSIQNDPEFSMYLNWCYTNKSCNRLQLADLLVKPVQRLTKYSLILCRVAVHGKTPEESVAINTMESYVKSYVTDLNRSMRQRDELDKIDELLNSIEPYELEFKDEEMERAFRTYCTLNLRAPMLRSTDLHLRNLLYECDLRFKDNIGKEAEVRLFLLTDMMIICKKQSKGLPYRMIRPKIFLEKLVSWQKSSKSQSNSLVYIIMDDCCSAVGCFTLSESSKDPTPNQTLKTLELKIKEAHLTRSMFLWTAMNPSRDLSEMESTDSTETKVKSAEETAITNEARERVASMLHRGRGVSTEECSQSIGTDSNEAAGGVASNRVNTQRQYMQRLSTVSSRQSRLSSFQQNIRIPPGSRAMLLHKQHKHKRQSKSTSNLVPAVTSITVDIVNELDKPTPPQDPMTADGLTVQVTPAPESPNLLSPHPQNNVSVLSRPDLSPEPISISFRRYEQINMWPHLGEDIQSYCPVSTKETSENSDAPLSPTASERLYRSHQELLQRKRLAASQSNQYLTPDHRGSSYPPPSPTRASLKRGLAFSYSFKNPPLSKMENLHSQLQLDASTSGIQQSERQPSPSLSEKSDKKNKESRGKATSSTDPESAVSSTCETQHSSVQDITESGAEKYRSDEEVE